MTKEVNELVERLRNYHPSPSMVGEELLSLDPPQHVAESAHIRDLRRRLSIAGTSLSDAARLAAVGAALADGARELRPCMSAEAARTWVQAHVDAVNRAHLDVVGSSGEAAYASANMRDLKDAVLGAAAELDEAGAGRAPSVIAAIYSSIFGRAEDAVSVGKWWDEVPWWAWMIAGAGTGYIGYQVFTKMSTGKKGRHR